MRLAIRNANLCTMLAAPQPGQALVCEAGRIAWIGPDSEVPKCDTLIDAAGGAVMPGLIDAHTHTVFAGDRLDEFVARSRGATYEEIAKRGGGIWKTVEATRAATPEQLFASGLARVRHMRQRGVTCIEGKSGYGLDEATERKILQTYAALQTATGVRIVRTFLGAHVRPRDYAGADYVGDVIAWLAGFADDGLCEAVDVFVEENAFSADDARRIAAAAREHALPVRLHVDQLTTGGGAALAAELSALSADHLEHMQQDEASLLARAGVVATLLPFAALLVGRGAKPPVAALRRAGVRMAIATDYNPGSAPQLDLRAAGVVALGLFGLSVDEVLLGMTVHAAAALGLSDHGALRQGAVANVLILKHPEPASLLYALGDEPIARVIINGAIAV